MITLQNQKLIVVYRVLVAAVVTLVAAKSAANDANPTENPQLVDANPLQSARDVLRNLDVQLAEIHNKQSLVEWNYASNLTDENLQKKLNLTVEVIKTLNEISREANNFPWADLEDENMKRQFKKFGELGTGMNSEEVRIHEDIPIVVNLNNKDISCKKDITRF